MTPSVMVHCPVRGAQECEIAVHCLSLPATLIMLIRKASSCQGCCNPAVGVSLELPWLVFPTQAPKGKVMGFLPSCSDIIIIIIAVAIIIIIHY